MGRRGKYYSGFCLLFAADKTVIPESMAAVSWRQFHDFCFSQSEDQFYSERNLNNKKTRSVTKHSLSNKGYFLL